MEECECVTSELGEEQQLIAAANFIVKVLGSYKNLTDDAKKVLADLCTQLSQVTKLNETNFKETEVDERAVEDVQEVENRLNVVQERIMEWEGDHSMIWESAPNEACEYLNAADEAQELVSRLESLCLNKDDEGYELLRKAHDVLQMSMARLEEEFRYMLHKNGHTFEPELMSFHSTEDIVDDGSTSLSREGSFECSVRSSSVGKSLEYSIIDLVNPDVISDLRGIANVMFKSGYDQECIQAYNNVRRDALNEYLSTLEIEKMSIEDVLKMDWVNLNSKIRKWSRAMKKFVRVYLASEKCLSDQIFEDAGPVSMTCFVEASKASMLQLLNFGEAMTIGPHTPEKLNRILEMYEVVGELRSDIDALYSGEVGYHVRTEYHDVLESLGQSVRATFLEFGKAIATNPSANPFAGGGIHHLTKYVMNYLLILTDYNDSLNFLLKDHDNENLGSPSSSMNPSTEEENETAASFDVFSPMARHFRSVSSILESNLEEKAKQYKDPALQHFFLMNNIHYMAQKVRDSELNQIFGDEWIRKHNKKFQQHAVNYQRASWSSLLSCLNNAGASLRERLRSFNVAFEEIYKTQTSWIIHNVQLRDDLRISTSQKVIQAYRPFHSRCYNNVSDRLIKYTPDDLEGYLLDLFEGSPKSLTNTSRR